MAKQKGFRLHISGCRLLLAGGIIHRKGVAGSHEHDHRETNGGAIQ